MIVSPAFQWAQDLNSVAISVKWANRPDSPACTHAYGENVQIEEDKIIVEAMCDKLDSSTKYLLELELFTKIDPVKSKYEVQSAGRIYLNLTKSENPSRWRWLTKSEERIPNMQLWWEIHEKFMDELETHSTFETDDNFDSFIKINEPSPKKGKNANKKKWNKKNQQLEEKQDL